MHELAPNSVVQLLQFWLNERSFHFVPLKLQIEMRFEVRMILEMLVEEGKFGCQLSKLNIGYRTCYPLEFLLEEQACIATIVKANNERHVSEP